MSVAGGGTSNKKTTKEMKAHEKKIIQREKEIERHSIKELKK